MTLAVIIGAHGVGGEVRLKTFTEDLSPYCAFNDDTLTLRSLRHGGNGTIARFDQIADRSAAEAMRGTELTVPRATLPALEDGEYYHADLIGLAVVDDTGRAVGIVASVENFGAGDILDIEKPDGKRFMVPVAVATIDARAVVPAAFVD